MDKLKMRRVQSDAGDQALQGFRRVILPVADHGVADCRKLRPNLILQSSHQRHPDQRRTRKGPLDGIPKLGAGGFGVTPDAQFLNHPHSSKVVDQGRLFSVDTPPNHRQVLPHRRMSEKLADEGLAVGLRFCEKQNAGREAIDAMDHQRPLLLPRQFRGNQRQGGRSGGAMDGHRDQARRLIENHHGIVFVKHGKFA